MTSSAKLQINIEIPPDVEVRLEDSRVTVTGPKGSLIRTLAYPSITIESGEGKVTVSAENKRRTIKAIVGTYAAHIRNMITGVTKGFQYKLKVVYSHFPITVKHSGDMIIIDNFLGEKTPRKSRVFGNCSISVKGYTITVDGVNIEEVAQTAANIEKATRVKGRDRRVFQDGIYMVEKGAVEQ
ncbi:MAG: 50S ribosomal protein L6 [Candidatus Hydrothermarchaeales archaeon]